MSRSASMYIIFDTNIWFSQLGLNSPSGAAVRFYARQRGAKVAVPEVVRLELEKNLTDHLQKMKKEIEDNHRQLLTIFGKLKEVVLPSDEQIRDKVSELLTNIDVPSIDIPLSLEASRSSFLKIIEKLPPSKNMQQFKDGVIWANCLELLREADVYLVSEDKDFYENKKYEDGLASNLSCEADEYPHRLELVHDLGKLLKSIKQEVQIDEAGLAKSVFDKSRENVEAIFQETGFSIGEASDIVVELFRTESAKQLYVKFQISYRCEDTSGQGRIDATLKIRGDGSYDTETRKCGTIRISNENFKYTDADGQEQTKGSHFLSATFTAGHRDVEHILREPLS